MKKTNRKLQTIPKGCSKRLLWLSLFVFLNFGAGTLVHAESEQGGISSSTLTNQEKQRVITGVVQDTKKQPLPGVTVMIKGTTTGVTTDTDGRFKIALPPTGDLTLRFSFIGMKTKEVAITTQKEVNVTLEEDAKMLEGVTVSTGYVNIAKESFTGSVKQVTREELMKVGVSNVLDMLQTFDPSLRIVKNNKMGSDPNTLPEMYLRGRTGMDAVKELDAATSNAASEFALTNNPNTPIFILDGFEVSVEKIFDLDINRIKDITILKDAAATAMYGSRASNGVLVFETIAPRPGELLITYNGTLAITAPDLSSYNMMNAEEKVQAEIASGLFTPELANTSTVDKSGNWRTSYRDLLDRLSRLAKGYDTYWLSQPLQTQYNHSHSVYVEGGSEDVRFGIEMRYNHEGGVMKESYRDRLGAGLTLDYRYNKLQIQNKINYDVMKGKDSPYGSFSDYSRLNPYAYWLDENGEYLKNVSIGASASVTNPLYDVQQGSFGKEGYTAWTENLQIRYAMSDYMQVRLKMAASINQNWTKDFSSPTEAQYTISRGGFSSRGSMTATETKTTRYSADLFAAYNRSINGVHNINFNIGLELSSNKQTYNNHQYTGFPSAEYNTETYAYEITAKPTFSDNHTRKLGFLAVVNYTFNNIYLFDASYRFDGSSEFGSDRKWAPFWSTGVGVNLHKLEMMQKYDWLNNFKVLATVGETGKSNFQPYVARNMLQMDMTEWYPTGIGTDLMAMGNESLTWESMIQWNFRAEFGLFNRVIFNFDYYIKNTKDMVTEVSLPLSSGFTKYTDNIGEVKNEGFEIDFNWRVYSSADWDVAVTGNLAHNENRLQKISESLKRYNTRVDEYYAKYNTYSEGAALPTIMSNISSMQKYIEPHKKYTEGTSLTTIYGMKSAGVNPADGQEIFYNRDGSLTYDWQSVEQQPIGDTEPDAQGSFGVNLRWKNFTMYTSFMYEWGGDSYNSTLVSNVETVDIYKYNADKRVLTDRWQKPGDVTPLKSIADRFRVTRPTSRFIQKNNFVEFNSLSLSYDFNRSLIQRIGLNTLQLKFNMRDIHTWSTIKQEMGLSFPFARTFNFTLNASF